jgi:uncharacterized membrane protein
MNSKNKTFLLYFLTLGGIVIWLGVIFLAPYLKNGSLDLNIFIYVCFSPTCHQIPARSFFIFGYPLAVCGRCLGIYFGFLGGTVLYPFLKGFSNLNFPKARTFILFSFPIVIDTMGNFFRLWMTPIWFRFFIGFLWGTILPFYFIKGFTDVFLRKNRLTKKGT